MWKLSKLVLLSLLILGWLTLPALSQATSREAKFKEYRQKLAQDLKLSPDKEKEFNDLGDRFLKQRMDLYGELNKAMDNLKQAAAATPADEARIKEAVDAVTVLKDKLWSNYQDWWHSEMKLLNPVQQAQYLITMEKWWRNIMSGHGGMGAEKQD